MQHVKQRIAVAALVVASSVALGVPAAAAAPAPVSTATTAGSAVTITMPTTGDRRSRRHHNRGGRFRNFGFPVVSPFFFGGGFGGFEGGFSGGGGCDIFLATGDLNSYILCRVG